MPLSNRALTFLATALVLLSEQGAGEIDVVVTNGFDIELTKDEEAAAFEAPGKLIANPSERLIEAIRLGQANATILDRRGNVRGEHPLLLLIKYPSIALNEFRTVHPAVQCEGTLYPVVWSHCEEKSETYLNLPGYGTVQIDPGTITKDEAEAVLAQLKYAHNFAHDVTEYHTLRYREHVKYYEVTGRSQGGSFSALIRPIRDDASNGYAIKDAFSH